ncbi:hypothetical protein I302_103578 [Kwoniella bestiolae CBS 10118]|uniref:Protein N-terminal amidase n=1 Tax=Kwoniella bestiolae CBS 10118 TaxID=1296100 RepID=A0A1B9G8U2_9TREE|nr:protein N-terminal amidase [Kwoniella bestiolae CBS 10118]OCF27437.1 protein N-terminal amidase [Kwoniella bestiolae CBS 10118]
MSHPSTAPPSRPSSPAPLYRRSPVRIACVQYDVKLGRVSENSAKVERMTRSLQPGSIDLLVLPEMCLSGYMFNSPTAILPYLEPQRIGPTSLLARSLAQRLKCYVIAGYPEGLPSAPQPSSSTEGISSGSESNAGPSEMKQLEGEGTGVGWNSAVVVAPSGEVVGNYRKTFRFETDKSWAREGDGFMHFDLPEPLGRVAVGICMDMNPKDFVAPWDAFELANYCRDNAVDMLVVPMNWLSPPAEPPEVMTEEEDPNAPSESNLNYWAARLQPLHDPVPGYTTPRNVGSDPVGGKEVVFVACNRVGTEEGTKFIGTSSVMTISSNPSRIELVECCNISEERVMSATVT